MIRYFVNGLILVAVLGTSMTILSDSFQSNHGQSLFILETANTGQSENDSVETSTTGTSTHAQPADNAPDCLRHGWNGREK